MNQSEIEANTCNRHQRRQNACEHGFASHWLRKWREFCQPITERCKTKLKQTRITCIFDTVENFFSEGTKKKGICQLAYAHFSIPRYLLSVSHVWCSLQFS